MRNKTLILLAAFICLFSTPTDAQYLRKYDVASGLSSNSIKGIIQDKTGYIWFATTDGLNSYNGNEFKSYGCSYQPSSKDSTSVLNLMTIHLHKDGRRIWAGTQSSSLYLFDPATEIFKEIRLKSADASPDTPNLCYSLAYDHYGKLWIGTDNGLYIYDEDSDTLSFRSPQNSDLPSYSISYVYCDSNGTIWVGSTKGLLKYNPATDNFIPAKIDSRTFGQQEGIHVIFITEDKFENLWIGTWDKGIAILNKDSNTLKSVKPSGNKEFSTSMRIRSILPDSGNIFWICTNSGLFKYNTLENTLTLVNISNEHPHDNIYSSLKDKEGGIWIGTFFQGIYYLSPRARQIECYTAQNAGDFMKGTAISSFCEDDEEMIYLTSENGSLSMYDPFTRAFRPTRADINVDNLHTLCMDGDDLYIGTYSHGLKHIDMATGKTTSYTSAKNKELLSNNVFSLYQGMDGIIYVGTDSGCTRFSPRSRMFHSINELEGEFIYDTLEDSFGNVWYATYYNGLHRYCKDSGQWKRYSHNAKDPTSLPHNKTLYLFIDDTDNLWICTEGGGACRFDYQNDCFERLKLKFNTKDVNLSTVNAMLSDSEGKLWLSSNNGIWTCHRDGNVIRHLTHEDGLQSNQYTPGAAFRSSTGKLFFGGVTGFNVITPERLRDNSISPTTTARISFLDRTGNTRHSPVVVDSGNITLPRNVSSFAIDFECLSYIAPHKNEFAYSIDDSKEWTYTTEPTVIFRNFPYGKYAIKVKARNGDGFWSANTAILEINNLPPFFKSIGAKTAYILIVFSLLIGGLVVTIRRHDKASNIKMTAFKIAQEEETQRAKTDFVTDVAGQEWFGKLIKLINDNISEPEISIERLASELKMSRSSFQRKLKTLTGLSPVEFIRLNRLKKAAELLKDGHYRVSEVAYMVGFNKPSYFTALFKKQFGVLPKEFKE